MSNNKYFVIPRQISFDKELLNQVQKFVIDSPAANDELIVLSVQSKYYSIRDLMKILHISTAKEVEYLIKKLKLEQANYRYFYANKKWVYNNNALNILNLYLKFKAA
jgi:hypothetical protein